MFIPILIPTRPHEPTRCPNCKEIENKKEVCKHCKYVYPEDEEIGNVPIIAYFIGAIVTFIRLLIYNISTKSLCSFDGCEFFDFILMFLYSFLGAMVWPVTLFIGLLFYLFN